MRYHHTTGSRKDAPQLVSPLADVRSRVIHPASTTHRQLTDDQRVTAGAGPDTVRLSVGIEDAADPSQALAATP